LGVFFLVFVTSFVPFAIAYPSITHHYPLLLHQLHRLLTTTTTLSLSTTTTLSNSTARPPKTQMKMWLQSMGAGTLGDNSGPSAVLNEVTRLQQMSFEQVLSE
jgi:hypothetical protein